MNMRRAFSGFLFLSGLFLCLLFAGCKSSPPVQETIPLDIDFLEFMDTAPGYRRLTFIGVADLLSNINESIELALEDAARRISIFHEVKGEFSVSSEQGGGFLRYRAEVSASLFYDKSLETYLDRLEFNEVTDVRIHENAVFVRVMYPESFNLYYHPYFSGFGDKLYWIEKPPVTMGGYTVGIGCADRRNTLGDTVTASYENAIFDVIRSLNSIASSKSLDYVGGGFLDIGSSIQSKLDAFGKLNGFYVLETWIDPSDKSVWTLAVAKSSGF